MEAHMLLKKQLIFTTLLSSSIFNLYASTSSSILSKHNINGQIPIEFQTSEFKQVIYVTEYKITNNNNLKGKFEFKISLQDMEEKTLKNLLVMLPDTNYEWFNLKLEECPHYVLASSKYRFLLFPYEEEIKEEQKKPISIRRSRNFKK